MTELIQNVLATPADKMLPLIQSVLNTSEPPPMAEAALLLPFFSHEIQSNLQRLFHFRVT